jgi:aldehyde dehydrogenase (NAD+)
MMSFTGSQRGGTAVTIDSAPTVKRVALELGGKSPNIIFADADLEEAVSGGVEFCYSNTGQSCDAPTRMLVESRVYDQAVEIAKRVTQDTLVGDPLEEGDHLGPLVSALQYERVQEKIAMGIEEVAPVVGGLGKPDGVETGFYVRPTLFVDVTNDMRIAREEVFGPVLVMMPFASEEEAIQLANETTYGLGAYISTADPERAKRVAKALRSGTVNINGSYLAPGTPFGGYRQSGVGREGGLHGLLEFMEVKAVAGA